MFDHTQIQDFKEAFNLIDRDGFVDKEDLHSACLGLLS